ncbi:uncharacterized protein EI97DRAFT_464511 [Westerdykella ornata]|uniref:C3H1-type domain-containing protein n=1 Tax=Westerdykella ornata TaxID=318751 RepID=A0A6A6JRE0_WESOR|nr:uncharacterized protein EI97DRAFT_464511 [Westerdykella ornata]KAF2279200.1 hypothetical protein EI97DRAFT_464511 [Westerdykella ornata]
MLVEESDKLAFKDWIIPKLEKISDADAGVLADYVIALIAAEETEDAVRNNCLDALSDFLQDHTAPFIDEVLAAVRTKSFRSKSTPNGSSKPTAPAQSKLSADAPPFNRPTGPANAQRQNTRPSRPLASPQDQRGEVPRKRKRYERDTSQPADGSDAHYQRESNGQRPLKEVARRGGRNSRGALGNVNLGQAPPALPSGAPIAPATNFPALPPLPPGFSTMNYTDPMALMAMMGMAVPGIPGFPFVADPRSMGRSQAKGGKRRCEDYDTKGFCALGSACPYEHGGEIVLPRPNEGICCPMLLLSGVFQPSLGTPSRRGPISLKLMSNIVAEYDPNQALLGMEALGSIGERERGHASGSARGSRSRAPFSQLGPNYDRSNSTIVVEQIPEENFSEDAVRGFFSQFGEIVHVDMQPYKRLAVVKYSDYFAARRAYDSPKVIFDNRFVKVYWYKTASLAKPPPDAGNGIPGESTAPDASELRNDGQEEVDRVEVERRQAEAQKAFEERRRKSQEAAARMEEVERKLKENEEQTRLLKIELAKRAAKQKDATALDEATLIDQLSSLQAEAQGLNADYDTVSARGRGRGTGFRGRGYPHSRGRGVAYFRGSYRGRGYGASPFGGGRSGVKRLDNRPRRVAIVGVEAGSRQDEVLREHLLNNYEYESIEPHPERPDTQVVSFKERYMAEMFIEHAVEIPDIGKMELAWVANAATTAASGALAAPAPPGSDGDIKMEEGKADEQASGAEQGTGEDGVENTGGGEADYDVADDEDRWMAA